MRCCARPRRPRNRPWSAWQPASNGVDPAQQIAGARRAAYRLDDGKQIVQVTGGPPTLEGQPLMLGVVRSGQTPAALEGNSVLYQLCGDGTDCSIKAGKASTERGLLLRREALELALYTFRYVGGANQVRGDDPATAAERRARRAPRSSLDRHRHGADTSSRPAPIDDERGDTITEPRAAVHARGPRRGARPAAERDSLSRAGLPQCTTWTARRTPRW